MARNSGLLFLSAFVRSPRSVGSVAPSSPALGRVMARHIDISKPGVIVELGGGTGSISKALLETGIPSDRLVVLERDPDLYRHLCREVPQAIVVHGDALDLKSILSSRGISQVNTVVCCIPMLTLPHDIQYDLYRESFGVMDDQGEILQYTYGIGCPVSKKALNRLDARGNPVNIVMMNIPPATVWRFRKNPA